MAAITTATNRTRIGALPPASPIGPIPIKGGIVIPQGAIVDRDANGYLVNAAANTTAKCLGIAPVTYDTTGLADGVKTGEVHFGVWCVASGTSGDAITFADVGKTAYVIDNNTVGKTDGSGARHAGGTIFSVEPDGSIGINFNPIG